jgi:hypothetical protein
VVYAGAGAPQAADDGWSVRVGDLDGNETKLAHAPSDQELFGLVWPEGWTEPVVVALV